MNTATAFQTMPTADLANRETIHRAIRDALKDKGIPVNYAVDVVSLISTGSIPFVTIEY